MNAREQRQILEAEDGTGEFIKLWTYKESCIKLSGEGLHQDMKTLKPPACHQFFWLEKDLAGCVAGEEPFILEIRRGSSKNPFSLKQMSAICCHKKRLSSYIYLKKR